MYHQQVKINELPNPVDRQTVLKYLNCTTCVYIVYSVLQVLGGLGLFLLTNKPYLILLNLVFTIVLILAACKSLSCKKLLRQQPFDHGKLRMEINFTYYLNWVVVILDFIGKIAFWFSFYELYKDEFKGGTLVIIYIVAFVVETVVMVPFFILICKYGAAKKAVEVVCGGGNLNSGQERLSDPPDNQ